MTHRPAAARPSAEPLRQDCLPPERLLEAVLGAWARRLPTLRPGEALLLLQLHDVPAHPARIGRALESLRDARRIP
jgi:hypothetical protein